MSLDVSVFFESPLKSIKEDSRFSSFNFPLYYPKYVEQDAILFIGINPSNEKNLKNEKEFEAYDLNIAKTKWNYFDRMQQIADYCNHPWSHIDLFHYRKTQQKDFYKIYNTENGVEYLSALLEITRNLINQAKPKVVVIANALAGEILKGEIQKFKKTSRLSVKLKFEFDESIGTHKWENVPVFFSSMLSGQRALDNGSFERLKWHIKYVLHKVEKQ